MVGKLTPAVLAFAIVLAGGGGCGNAPTAVSADRTDTSRREVESVDITIVYDNNPWGEGLETDWGFACVVSLDDHTMLFDTGGNGRILLSNMRALDIDPAQIDVVVLSHVHGDHVGGLEAFLTENSHVTVWMPASFPANLKRGAERLGASVREVTGPVEILPGAWSTGELSGPPPEQSLLLQTRWGAVVVTGCAHPGVVKIVERAKQVLPGEVALVLGGYHLGAASPAQVEGIARRLQELDVRRVAPCHCTGDRARAVFQQAYGDRYLAAGVGKRIAESDLGPAAAPDL